MEDYGRARDTQFKWIRKKDFGSIFMRCFEDSDLDSKYRKLQWYVNDHGQAIASSNRTEKEAICKCNMDNKSFWTTINTYTCFSCIMLSKA